MSCIRFRAKLAATLLTALSCTNLTQAQNSPAAPSLQELLKNQYKISKTGSDASGFKIIEPGTVLTIQKAGLIATPQPASHFISLKLPKVCDNTFKRGNLTQPGACAKTTLGSKFLNEGEKVYITKFEVNEKSNRITFNLVECDSCNGVTKNGSMKATVHFEFADKFLETAEPDQVSDVIHQLLRPAQ